MSPADVPADPDPDPATMDYVSRSPAGDAPNEFGELTIARQDETGREPVPQPPADRTGRFGKYHVVAEIGRGAFGTVYRGFDPQLDRPVAIKVPRMRPASSTTAGTTDPLDRTAGLRPVIDDFLREARKLAALKHPGIVTVLDVNVHGEECLIVSEFLDGPNLNQWMADRTVPWAESVRLTAAIADALAYAHSRSTVHRDLKPGNVILVQRADGLQPVLVDFGLALDDTAAAGSQRGVIAGTPNYMSPEQTRGEGHRIDGRTDIYALGTILYRLLCGRLPFTAPTVVELLQKVAGEDPVPPRQLNRAIPRELERICLKAMSKRVADRYTTAADLAADLRELLRTGSDARPGAPGEDRPRERVQRQVTAVACRHDLLDSPTFVDALEPDRQFDALAEFQRHCDETAREFGGHCAELTGEAAVVCFGFPTAHEDAAHRAVGAALALRDRLRDQFARLGRECGFTPRFRVGVHTAAAVVYADPEPRRNDLLLTGEARHVADRLARTAGDAAVTVSGETARRMAGYFTTESAGRCRPPGAPRELELFRVVGRGAARSRIDVGERAGLTPLVGRDTELDVLKDLWDQAKEGYGQLVCVIGEAGLGKSRLVRELSDHLARDGGEVIEWRASALFSSTGLHPAAEWLGRTLGFDRLTPAARLDRLVEHLTALGIGSPDTIALFAMLAQVPTDDRCRPPALSPMKMLEKTLGALELYLRRRGERAPVLFVVEDLHWIDPTSLEFLARLADGDGLGRLVTLATFRPEFVTPWGGRANHTHLALNRLTASQIEDMLRKRTGLDRVPADLVGRIVARTEGVPLFIEEYANLVTESGAVRQADGRTVLADGFTLQAIPATLQDLLVSRLDRLRSVHDVAQLGSALGRRFTFDTLRAVSGMDDGRLRTELDKLVGAEILFQDGEPPRALYTFKHALIQDAAYGSLTKKGRTDMHRRIGEVLEAQFPETAAAEPALLAHHFTAAAVADKAVPYWLKAGQLSQEQSANREAIEQFRRGLALVETLPASPERDGIELSFKLPYSAVLMGVQGYAAPEVESVQNRCIDICRSLGAAAPLFPVLLANWVWLFVRGRFADCYRRCPEVIAMAEREGGPGMAAEARWTQVCTSFYAGDFPTTLTHAEIGWAAHQRDASVAFAKFTQQNSGPLNLSNLGLALWQLGRADEGLRRVHEALALSIDLRHVFTQAVMEWMVAQVYEFAKLGEKTVEYGRRCRRIGDEQAFAMWQGMGEAITGIGLKHLGRYDEAIAALRTGTGIIESTSALICGPKYAGHLADALWLAGRRDEAVRKLDEAFEKQATGEYFTHAELLRFRGDFAYDRGDFDEAEAHYNQSLAVAVAQGAKFYELRTTLRLSRIWRRQGNRELAGRRIKGLVAGFTEGFDMPDLLEANALLSAL